MVRKVPLLVLRVILLFNKSHFPGCRWVKETHFVVQLHFKVEMIVQSCLQFILLYTSLDYLLVNFLKLPIFLLSTLMLCQSDRIQTFKIRVNVLVRPNLSDIELLIYFLFLFFRQLNASDSWRKCVNIPDCHSALIKSWSYITKASRLSCT